MGDLRKPAGQQRSMLGEICSRKFGHNVSKSNTSHYYHYVHCMTCQRDALGAGVYECVWRHCSDMDGSCALNTQTASTS